MVQRIKEVMTAEPTTLPAAATVEEAARAMRDHDIGDVIVLQDDQAVCGIVTDRDLVVRALAESEDPRTIKLADICSRDITSLSPESSVGEAVKLMRDKAIRRLPVLENGRPVGIVSIGDLAVKRDPDSALADISAAPANT